MDEYEQYLADFEYDQYINQFNAESTPKTPKPPASALGADYTKSAWHTPIEALSELPLSLMQFGKSAYNLLQPFDALAIGDQPSGLYDTIANAGAEKTARTTGGIAAGLAGAASLAPWAAVGGAALGGPFAPITGAMGGIVGGAAGFAGGMTGFNMTNDVIADEFRPASEYGKDFIYDTTQNLIPLMGFKSYKSGARGVRKAIEPYTQTGMEGRVLSELNTKAPGWYDTVNDTFPPEGTPPPPLDSPAARLQADPFKEYKSLGELLENPVLKNEQRTLARASPEGYGKATEANAIRNDAQLKWLDQIEQSQLTPGDTQASIMSNVEGDLVAKQQAVDSATDRTQSLTSSLPPTIDLIDAGSTIREGVSEGLNSQRGLVTAGFEGAGNGIVGREPIFATLAQEVPKYFREVGAQPIGDLANLIDELSKQGEPIMVGDQAMLDANRQPIIREVKFTVRDMQAMRSSAIKIVKGSDARSAGVAGKIIGAIDQSLDDAVNRGSLSPAEIESLRKGISARKAQGDIFEGKGSPSKAVLDTNYSGSYSVPDSAVPNRYFRPGEKGTREGMQNYKKAFGNTPEALEPIHRYATDSFRRFAVDKDGLVNTKKARAWLDQHAEVLKEAPELRQQFENTERAQTFLNEKFGDMKRTTAEVQKGALQLWLKDIDPKAAIKEMLSGKDMARRIKSTTDYLKSKKDPDATLGLKRGIIEYMEDKVFEANAKVSIEEARLPGGARFDGKTKHAILALEWNRIKPALIRSKLYTDSQIKNFNDLYKDKASQLSVENAKMPAGSDTLQNSTTLAALTKIASNTFLQGYPTTRYIVSVLAPILKAIPEGRFLSLLEDANLNPRLARDLQNKANARNITKTAEMIFKEDLNKSFGDTSKTQALKTGAGITAPFLPSADSNNTEQPIAPAPRPKPIPKQEAITSKKSFPSPSEILNPPAKGYLRKSSLDLSKFSAETQARIAVESSGNPDAVSPKGAQGLSQLMPSTAQEIATELGETYTPIRSGMSPEDRSLSIEQNVRFGDHYYNKQLKRFKNPTLARAAYNAGPRRVEDAMKMAGSERDVNKILSNLPKGVQQETIPYVNKIMARLGQG